MNKILKELAENGINFNSIKTSTNEEKLMLEIYHRRYENLSVFVEQYINFLDVDKKKTLIEYYFTNNGLKEFNFIGTDFYINAKFIMQKVPYLYRCVGKDNPRQSESIPVVEHLKNIVTLCKEQIETGGKGQLFSYSKCFGLVLYKYSTATWFNESIMLEVRKNAYVNAIGNDNNVKMLQEYDAKCAEKKVEDKDILPFFSVDMSNARNNDEKYLEYWIEEYLGKQNWHYGSQIVDPIGDAEVVRNFTGEEQKPLGDEKVERINLDLNKFCKLLYMYFRNYYLCTHNNTSNRFDTFLKKSVETIQNDNLKDYYEQIMKGNCDELNKLLDNIDWDLEKTYLTRRKDSGNQQEKTHKDIEPYKGDNAEEKSRIWKEILFEAVREKYSYVNFGGNNAI